MGDRSQIMSLQRQISDLQSQLANKNAQISSLEKQNTDLQQQISNLQSQLESKNALISDLQQQISNLQDRTSYLQNEINRIMSINRIVQSEDYLFQIKGTLQVSKCFYTTSTYFTTLGKQIKIDAKLRADAPVWVDFDSCYIEVYYVYGGQNIKIEWSSFQSFSNKRWDFGRYSELNDTIYLKLDDIPENLFGKVPLYIYLHLKIDSAKVSTVYVFFEVTAYDVYPP